MNQFTAYCIIALAGAVSCLNLGRNGGGGFFNGDPFFQTQAAFNNRLAVNDDSKFGLNAASSLFDGQDLKVATHKDFAANKGFKAAHRDHADVKLAQDVNQQLHVVNQKSTKFHANKGSQSAVAAHDKVAHSDDAKLHHQNVHKDQNALNINAANDFDLAAQQQGQFFNGARF